MTEHRVHDLPALFDIDGAELDGLAEREIRLLVGALNFHAIMAPERELTAHLYGGGVDDFPRLTDDATFDGFARQFRHRLRSIRFRSLVAPEQREPTAGEAVAQRLAAGEARHLHISSDEVVALDPERPRRRDLVGRVARRVKAAAPLMYDEVRDVVLLRHRPETTSAAPRQRYQAQFQPGGVDEDFTIVPAPPVAEGAQKAVIIGMHWFELGGAERWAFETVRLVREAGFLPIVLTNKDSHHAWILREELEGALLLPFSESTSLSQTPGTEQLLRTLVRLYDVRGVVVHHNQWLYDRLAWIRQSRPGIPVVDSTHIVEYRGGGYPRSSAIVTDSLTTHHVISPSLAAWMTEVQGIAEEKVVMAPLGGLTIELRDARFRPRDAGEPFTVAFIGRQARQKAPEVFVEMVKKLNRSTTGLRFIMHGDGEQSGWIDDIIAADGLSDVIVRRTSAVPVAETLDEAHVLVISSHNEGLTLTTLEAIAHGVPVVSTDVGAQGDIIPASALVSRNVHRAVTGLAAAVRGLAQDESAREELWRRERKAEKKLLANKTATDWFTNEVATW
ncbi:glycosyltransferase [Microbacterium sp. 22242]|uniref:glycosyltransferase n=1 Tax=Microbacterium sp. 22242 TaxID=3453896 RepID=UPI003F862958